MVLHRRHEGRWNAYRAAARAGLIVVAVGCSALAAPDQKGPEHRVEGPEKAAKPDGKSEQQPSAHVEPQAKTNGENSQTAKQAEHHSEPDPIKITDWITAISAAVSGVFAVILGVSTIGLWLATKRLASEADEQHETLKASVAEAKRAADIAKQSAEAASRGALATERALELTVRPWMRTEASIVTDLLVREEFAQLIIQVRSTNVGNAPAVGVSAGAVMIPRGESDNINVILNGLAALPRSRNVGDTMFVGETHEVNCMVNIDRVTLERARAAQAAKPFPQTEVFVVGFVGYWGPANYMLRAPFIFQLVRPDERGGEWYRNIDLRADTPKAELKLNSSWLFGAAQADYGRWVDDV